MAVHAVSARAAVDVSHVSKIGWLGAGPRYRLKRPDGREQGRKR